MTEQREMEELSFCIAVKMAIQYILIIVKPRNIFDIYGAEIVFLKLLSPIHTKNNNYKDNHKDNNISVHTSKIYRLFILSARVSTALNSRAHYIRMDSDWLSMFYRSSAGNKTSLKWLQQYYFFVPLSL